MKTTHPFRRLVNNMWIVFFTMSAGSAEIDFLTVSPRSILLDESGFLDEIATGYQTVGIGQKIYLQLSASQAGETYHGVEWTLILRPDGSTISISSPNQATIAIQPDKEGWYEVACKATNISTGETIDLRRSFLCATYAGAGGLNGAAPDFPECGLCHGDVWDEWAKTNHSKVLQSYLNGERSGHYRPGDLAQHSLGYDPNPLAKNNGFDDALSLFGIKPQSIADRVNEAYRLNHDRNHGNDVSYYDTLPGLVMAKASVQCENCHGPGTQHFGSVDRIGISWSAKVCLTCHDSPESPLVPYISEERTHSHLTGMFEEYPILKTIECAKCHTAEGFVAIQVENDAEGYYASGIDAHALTCVACHDPHDRHESKHLRKQGDIVMESGHVFKDGGKGSACVACHESRINLPLEDFIRDNTGGSHYGPQPDVMLGVSAWDFGVPFSGGVSVHKILLEDTCVTCHLAPTPENGFDENLRPLVGGHTFRISYHRDAAQGGNVDNIRNACMPCHLQMKTTDRRLARLTDLDANGIVEGVQSEIRGLLGRIATGIQRRYPEITIPENGDFAMPSKVFARMSFTEKAVVHNYRLILRDRSYGVHNVTFSIEALTRAWNALQ